MELNVAVVGAGRWGKNLVRAFGNADRCRLHTVCDSDPTTLEAQRQFWPDARVTSEAGDVFGDPRVRAVVLATPARSHSELALEALASGKDVFVEKPMALASSEALALDARARATGRALMVGHLLEYHPAVVALRGLLVQGALGEVRYALAERTGPAPGGRDISAWWALAPHDVSVLRYLFGKNPTAVRAYGYGVDGEPGEELVTARVAFDSGLTGFLHIGALTPGKTRRLTVVASERIAVFDDLEPIEKLRLYRNTSRGWGGLRRGSVRVEGQAEHVAVGNAEPLRIEAQHFVDSVLDGTPIRTDVSDGVAVTLALEAGSRSIASRGESARIDELEAVARSSAKGLGAAH